MLDTPRLAFFLSTHYLETGRLNKYLPIKKWQYNAFVPHHKDATRGFRKAIKPHLRSVQQSPQHAAQCRFLWRRRRRCTTELNEVNGRVLQHDGLTARYGRRSWPWQWSSLSVNTYRGLLGYSDRYISEKHSSDQTTRALQGAKNICGIGG